MRCELMKKLTTTGITKQRKKLLNIKSGNDKALYTAHTEYFRNIEINIENAIRKQATTTEKSTLSSVLFCGENIEASSKGN